jgi:hypothetical protein
MLPNGAKGYRIAEDGARRKVGPNLRGEGAEGAASDAASDAEAVDEEEDEEEEEDEDEEEDE